jgi:hypothetical protein
MKLCFVALLGLAVAQQAPARPAQIILLRHAEKPPGKYAMHLDERGEARAQALVSFVTTNRVMTAHGLPAALFAPRFTARGHAQRPYETLQPLAEHLHLPIQTPFGSKEVGPLAKLILRDASLDGKTVVICWVHDQLPALAKSLGVKPEPEPWPPEVYNRVWRITYHKHHAALTTLEQHLLPGDQDSRSKPDAATQTQSGR